MSEMSSSEFMKGGANEGFKNPIKTDAKRPIPKITGKGLNNTETKIDKNVVKESAETVIINESAKKAVENLKFLRDNWLTPGDSVTNEQLFQRSRELDELKGKWNPLGIHNKKISELSKELEDGKYLELQKQRKLGFSNTDSNDFKKFDIDMHITRENIETADKMWDKSTFFDDRHKGWGVHPDVLSAEAKNVRNLNHNALDGRITNEVYVNEMIKVLKHTYGDLLVDKTKGGKYEFAPYVIAFITAKMNLSITSKDKISLTDANKNLEEIGGFITHISKSIDPYRMNYLEKQFGQLKASFLKE